MNDNDNGDRRPDPKPRKHPQLWQAYLWRDELVEIRKRHVLRVSSSERGKSNLDAQFEKDMMQHAKLDELVRYSTKIMVEAGKAIGPIWDWMVSIRGLGEGGLAAQLLAQIDDIAAFGTVSKLWRFTGQAVIDGQAEKNQRGEKSHYNRRLKAMCYLIADSFIKQQTPPYVDIYYDEKERLRRLHPHVLCRNEGVIWEDCEKKKEHKRMYNDGHLHHMAMRKMIKIFLQHLWVTWRQYEGLPISQPYVQAIMGHANIVPAPMEAVLVV